MLLFQALRLHLFGKSFKLEMINDLEWKVKYYNLLRMFMDNNNPGPVYNSSPFGIHSIC